MILYRLLSSPCQFVQARHMPLYSYYLTQFNQSVSHLEPVSVTLVRCVPRSRVKNYTTDPRCSIDYTATLTRVDLVGQLLPYDTYRTRILSYLDDSTHMSTSEYVSYEFSMD